MSKRSILISLLIAINVAIIAAIVWHRHMHSTLSARLADAGLTPARFAEFGLVAKNITPAEFQDATNMFVQERRMWSRFNGMSADMSIEFEGNDGKRLSLEGNVTLHRLDLSPSERTKFLAKYDMTISDKRGGWTVTTDGTSKNTVITCPDPQMSEAIKTIDPASLLYLLTFPQYATAMLYNDGLYPPNCVNPYTLDECLRLWKPWHMTNAAPYSYTFFDSGGDSKHVRLDFMYQNGHFSRWRRTQANPGEPVAEMLAIYFENPVQSGGFWYPTVFRITPAPTPWPFPKMTMGWFYPVVPPYPAGKGQLCITLSDVSVKVK